MPVRQRFLTQYLLADDNEERQSLIEEIEDEQKENGLTEGGTVNETQMIAAPQVTPIGNNSLSYAESIGLPEDEKKDAQKRKTMDDLRKQREELMEEEMELVRMGTMDVV